MDRTDEAAMRYVVPSVIALALALALGAAPLARAGGLAQLHDEGGFVDAKLGDPIEAFPGLKLIGTDEAAGTRTYIRRSDDLRVGGALVDGVTYSFFEDRLYFISIRMSGKRNSDAVLAAFEAVYGPGIQTGSRPNERIWPGGRFFALYDFDPETGRGMAAMTSTPIQARMRLAHPALSGEIGDGY